MEDINGKRFIVNAWGEKTEVEIFVSKYAEGEATAIQLFTTDELHEPFATLTCNVPGTKLEDDEVLIKGWSENEPVVQAALASGLFE